MIQRYETPKYDDIGMQESDDGEWVRWDDATALLRDLVAQWRTNISQHPMNYADELEELLK
jgi:hypothetical protein